MLTDLKNVKYDLFSAFSYSQVNSEKLTHPNVQCRFVKKSFIFFIFIRNYENQPNATRRFYNSWQMMDVVNILVNENAIKMH